MTRIAGWLLLITALTLGAQEPNAPEEVRPREAKPQWQRMLTDAYAKKAAKLEKQLDAAKDVERTAEALKLAEELVWLRSRVQGKNHWQFRDAKNIMDDLARGLSQSQRNNLRDASSLNSEAMALCSQGKYEDAIELAKKVFEVRLKILGEYHPLTGGGLSNIGTMYSMAGRHSEAEPLLKQALKITSKTLGDSHPNTANSLNSLAFLYTSQDRYGEAEPLFRRALDIYEDTIGKNHSTYALAINNLAVLYEYQAKYAEAESMHREALRINRSTFGEASERTVTSLNNVATNCKAQGRLVEAARLYTEVLRIRADPRLRVTVVRIVRTML